MFLLNDPPVAPEVVYRSTKLDLIPPKPEPRPSPERGRAAKSCGRGGARRQQNQTGVPSSHQFLLYAYVVISARGRTRKRART